MKLTRLQNLDQLQEIEIGIPIVFTYKSSKSVPRVPFSEYDPLNPVLPKFVECYVPIYGDFAGYNPECDFPVAVKNNVELSDSFTLRSNRGNALETELKRIADDKAEFRRKHVEPMRDRPGMLKIPKSEPYPNSFLAERVGRLYVVSD
tara:strand:- start:144 stop:587 length:444 start_codon:yes stop_codon:yes gene_type:complete